MPRRLRIELEAAIDHVWTYTWDYRNRLAGVVGRNSVGTLLMQGTYTYDPTDRRIGVDDTVSGVETKTWTVYDGSNTYADFGGGGTLQQRYLHGPAADQILTRSSSGGSTAWYLTDKLGTVRDVANASGTVIDHVAYDSYGNLASETNAASGDRFKFAGRELDAATGLYYYRARRYDPLSGRFISQDPIRFLSGDVNFYRYVGDAPTNGTDPTGLQDNPTTSPPGPPRQYYPPGSGMPYDGHAMSPMEIYIRQYWWAYRNGDLSLPSASGESLFPNRYPDRRPGTPGGPPGPPAPPGSPADRPIREWQQWYGRPPATSPVSTDPSPSDSSTSPTPNISYPGPPITAGLTHRFQRWPAL